MPKGNSNCGIKQERYSLKHSVSINLKLLTIKTKLLLKIPDV